MITPTVNRNPAPASDKAGDLRAMIRMLTRIQRGQFEMQQRLVRMETRLVRLMSERGLDAEGDSKDQH